MSTGPETMYYEQLLRVPRNSQGCDFRIQQSDNGWGLNVDPESNVQASILVLHLLFTQR